MVIASFLRLVTPPKIFVHPTPVSEALRSVDALLAAPSVERPQSGCRVAHAAQAMHHDNFKRLFSRAQFTRLSRD